MSTTTNAQFRESTIALSTIETRLYKYVEEAQEIDESLQNLIDRDLVERLGPNQPSSSNAFFGKVEAIVAAEQVGTLGHRLSRLADLRELDIIGDADTIASLESLKCRVAVVATGLVKVQDDFDAILRYCCEEASDAN